MQLDYTVRTEKPYDVAVAAVAEQVAAHGFRVQCVHDVHATIAEKGFECTPVTIVEVCNAKYASQVLAADVKIGLMLPCPIMIYVEDGTTFISTMKPSLIAGFFPDADISEVAQAVEAVLVDVIDEASA